jgi:hypothetical protein
MATPILSRSSDRSYTLLSDPSELRALFQAFGFRHFSGTSTDLWSDRWLHDSKEGRSVLVLFPSGRLSILGPLPGCVNTLVVDGGAR